MKNKLILNKYLDEYYGSLIKLIKDYQSNDKIIKISNLISNIKKKK